jgi:transcriptional regulator with XRE-family HTH domain
MAPVFFTCQGTGISVTLDDVSSRSLAEVIGANCKRIRSETGFTQDQLALYARLHGLRWNAAKVGDFEAGRSAPTFATVLVVGMVLQRARSQANLVDQLSGEKGDTPDVTLADLLDGADHGFVALTDSLAVKTADLADVARGQPFSLQWYEDPLLERSGLTEQRLAKRLGISHSRLADVSFQLWHSTFSEERDRRAGLGANQQKKGRTSRELRAELEKALTGGDDQ